tara:strand:- start:560 stop:853 length:294 start_codon:yes stop_codon:yes gene_type:complete
LVKSSKNNNEKMHDLENALSTEQVLKEIGDALNKEKVRREKVQKKNRIETIKLSQDMLIEGGESDFDTPIPKDLATLKSLIQTIVKLEIGRSKKTDK